MDAPSSKPRAKARILVVDDHPLFREGLVRVLNREKDLEVCGESPDAAGALKQIPSLKPDLVIVDISLDGMNGIELTKVLHGRYPQLQILIVSMHKESIHAERALRAGAHGYIMKREDGALIVEAIRKILEGQIYVSKRVNEVMLQKIAYGRADPEPADCLSDRELEIFGLIGQGHSSREMADQLHISIKTVETHRERIREKLSLASSAELVQQAIHWFHHETGTR